MEAVLAPAIRRKLLPSLGIFLVAGGLFLLGWVAWAYWRPGPTPYHYQLVKEGGVRDFAALGLEDWPELKIASYELHMDGIDTPLALAQVARRGAGAPLVLDWDNRSGEPLLSVDMQVAELKALARAITQHTPDGALLLGWWDTSQALRLLTGREALFDAHLGEPLILPSTWPERGRTIARYEREFWGVPPAAAGLQRFRRFAEALSLPPAPGAAVLRELAGNREAYVVVHVSDLYKLGLMRPERLGVAFKDFPVKGDLHGPIGFVKRWMSDNHYSAYAVHERSDSQARAYFLTDAHSGETLLAQMLPFTVSRPAMLQALQLVYQHGGYWVYRVPAAPPAH